jgi:hypothetical protein
LSVYGLYVINLYWFLIMNKIAYKWIAKQVNINTDTLCHFLCSYIHWINIPLAVYLYSHKPHEKHILDLVGITVLSISSHQYHYRIYNRLYAKRIDEYTLPDRHSIVSFLNDSLCIHVRSILVVATHYYNSGFWTPVLVLSGIFHTASVYYCVLNILQLFMGYGREETEQTFLKIHNMMMAMPILADVFFVFMVSPTEIGVPFLFVNIVMGLLFVVDPFYKLTHVAFHLLLIAQNYYMLGGL